MGLTRIEACEQVGVPWKTFQSWMHKYKTFFDDVEGLIKNLRKPNYGDVAPIKLADYGGAAQQRLGQVDQILGRALSGGDLKLAMEAAKEIHKILNLTTKVKVEHGGQVTHEHRVVPAGLLNIVNNPRVRRGKPVLQIQSGDNQ